MCVFNAKFELVPFIPHGPYVPRHAAFMAYRLGNELMSSCNAIAQFFNAFYCAEPKKQPK